MGNNGYDPRFGFQYSLHSSFSFLHVHLVLLSCNHSDIFPPIVSAAQCLVS